MSLKSSVYFILTPIHLEILDLYLDIKFAIEDINSHVQVIPSIFKTSVPGTVHFPIAELMFLN